MPHGYCNGCSARVTVVDGRCLLGHRVDPTTFSNRRGRRLTASDHGLPALAAAAAGILEKTSKAGPTPSAPVSPLDTGPNRKNRTAPPTRPSRGEDTGPQRRSAAAVMPRPARPSTLNPTSAIISRWLQAADTSDLPAMEAPDESLTEAPVHRPIEWAMPALLLGVVFAILLAAWQLIPDDAGARKALAAEAGTLIVSVGSVDPADPVPGLAEIENAARSLFNRADGLPVGDSARALAIDAAGRALEAERTASAALTYQTAINTITERPTLPTVVTKGGIAATTSMLDDWIDAVQSATETAPSTDAFADHRASLGTLRSEITAQRSRYLQALRSGDDAAAARAIATIDRAVADIRQGIAPAVRASIGALSDTAGELASLLKPVLEEGRR